MISNTDSQGRRQEYIFVNFYKGVNDPGKIYDQIRVFKGPREIENLSDLGGIAEIMRHYFSNMDEQISIVKHGLPPGQPYKTVRYRIVFNDDGIAEAIEEGVETPLCGSKAGPTPNLNSGPSPSPSPNVNPDPSTPSSTPNLNPGPSPNAKKIKSPPSLFLIGDRVQQNAKKDKLNGTVIGMKNRKYGILFDNNSFQIPERSGTVSKLDKNIFQESGNDQTKQLLRLTQYISKLKGIIDTESKEWKNMSDAIKKNYNEYTIFNFDLRPSTYRQDYQGSIKQTIIIAVLKSSMPQILSNHDYGKLPEEMKSLYSPNVNKQSWNFIKSYTGGKRKQTIRRQIKIHKRRTYRK